MTVIITLSIFNIFCANSRAFNRSISSRLKFFKRMFSIKRNFLIFFQNEIFCMHVSTIKSRFLLEQTEKIYLKSSQKQITLFSKETRSSTSQISNIIRLTINMSHFDCMKNSFQKINLICLIKLTRSIIFLILHVLEKIEFNDILKRACAV